MGKRSQTIRNKRKIRVSNYENDVVNTKDAKKIISKDISRELKITIISIFAVTIIMIASAFAIFSSVQKQNKHNTLVVGTLKIDFVENEDGMGNVINLNGAYPESDEKGMEGEPYTFKITNSGTLEASYKIKILDDMDIINEDGCSDKLLPKDKIKVSIDGNEPILLSTKEGDGFVIETGMLKSNDSRKHNIRIWIDELSGNEVLGKHYHGKILIESVNSQIKENANILVAYEYDEVNEDTKCIIGNESTCVETKCYGNGVTDSCKAGTIIKYKINNTQEEYFYVINDNGSTLTVQQAQNTVTNLAWDSENADNKKGPLVLLQQVENMISTWTNVENTSYTMGISNFIDNSYTGCLSTGCTVNTYTTNEIKSKARLITVQEYLSLCANSTCPLWLNNSIGSYWTMSANSDVDTQAWYINSSRELVSDNINNNLIGARAVITISK